MKWEENSQTSRAAAPDTPGEALIQYAIEESRALNHNYVGTEHLLLGVVRELDGVAAQVLMNVGIDLASIRPAILAYLAEDAAESAQAKINPPNPACRPVAPAPAPSARLTKALANILDEYLKSGQNQLGTHHLLLALLRDPHCAATRVFTNLGLTPQAIRDEVLKLPMPPE